MEFPIPQPYQTDILRQYAQNLSRHPVIKSEVEAFLRDSEETFALCVKYLYGHMAVQDLLSFPVETFAGYVRATVAAIQQIDYLKTVPPEVFFPYVLYHRVNSEYADNSRGYLLETLLPHVRGKTMEQAALAVNYWCYAHATYTPADDRTLGPLGVLSRTLGRCGEESVLTVAALRSVGIPARQVYCPRWSHCDDNHAWVEVWIEGRWHYLGACEPEPVLDRGWFTAAASRAMRVDTKQWSGDGLYETVNCTGRYTDTKLLTVGVTEDGRPVPGAQVRFQIVNYSELYTLWETATNEQGLAQFETGPGDLLIYARRGTQVALEKVDLRQHNSITLELRNGFPTQMQADLVPPGDSSHSIPVAESSRHRELLTRCETHLAARRAVFSEAEGYLRLAARNAPEIQAFLADPRYPQPHKEELLRTLRPKDFADITRATLTDALDAADPARDQYAEDIFRDYILSPRIADEMLLPERQAIRALFPQGFATPGEVLEWMQIHMECLPHQGIDNFYPSALGCLRHRQVPAFAFDMVFVALCRAFCFPARLDSRTGQAQWLDSAGLWQDIRPTLSWVQLTLELPAGKKLHYAEHFSLGQWDGKDFVTLQYPELTVEGSHTFSLQPGLYRITATTRQIDGTASVVLRHLTVTKDATLALLPPEDQTPLRLKQIPLELPEGPLRDAITRDLRKNLLLIFADPGSEPTEHLLAEMLDLAEDYRRLPCRILLLLETKDSTIHPTVLRWNAALPEAEVLCLQDPGALAALHLLMQTGDLRLPFAVCADHRGRGVHADANYRIRMAQTLLDIQKLLL